MAASAEPARLLPQCSFDWVEGCASNGPRGEIVRLAEEENVDLVVLGSHGHDSTLERCEWLGGGGRWRGGF